MDVVEKYALGICILLLMLFLSPYYISPETSLFLIHDNLDSNVIWYSTIAKKGYLFSKSSETVPFIFDGIPRGCYPSELNLAVLFYYFFNPLLAYCINNILLHAIAFTGASLLLKNYILNSAPKRFIYFTALCFAILPFWPSAGISVAGMPLVLWAFENIKNSRNLNPSFIVIMLFPFYSSFVFSSLFFLIAMTAYYFIQLLKKEKVINYKLLAAFAIFGILMFLVEYRLFIMQFVYKIETQRGAFESKYLLGIKDWFAISFKHFLYGQYHFHSFQLFILISAFSAFFISDWYDRKKLLLLLLTMFLISLQYKSNETFFLYNFHKAIKMKNTLQLRFYSLYPILSFILLVYTIKVFIKRSYKYAASSIILIQLLIVGFFPVISDYKDCLFVEAPASLRINKAENCSYDDYYMSDVFEKIKKKVIPGNYNVMGVGFESQLVQMHNYNTIDGYHYFYPKSKVEMIEKITKPYYDLYKKNFVSKSRSSIYLMIKKGVTDSSHLYVDFTALRAEHCKYIFSKFKLNNSELKTPVKYSGKKEEIYVYEIL